jgi:hypothetical protein
MDSKSNPPHFQDEPPHVLCYELLNCFELPRSFARFFVGMMNDEAAEALGVSVRTAKYYWTNARAWLFRELGASPSRAAG